MNDMKERGNLKERVGVVISDKMQKTIVVKIDDLSKDSRYHRIVQRSRRFKVHDEENKAKVGDRVKIAETRPISKDKRWRLVEVLK